MEDDVRLSVQQVSVMVIWRLVDHVYFVLHDASSDVGMGVSVGSIRLLILTASLSMLSSCLLYSFLLLFYYYYYYIVFCIYITAPWRP